MATRPPLSNLSPMAEPWARWVTDQTVTNAEAIERLGGDASNDGRINNSIMDNLGAQLNEIYQRQSGYVSAAPMTTAPFNGTGTNAPMIAREIQLPRPTDRARSGWFGLSFNVAQTTSDFGSAFITIYIDGRIFHKISTGFPTSLVTPPAWGGNINVSAFSALQASPDSGGLVRIELTPLSTSGPTLRTVTASDFQVTYQYSQAI